MSDDAPEADAVSAEAVPLYVRVGGRAFFASLVEGFYRRVADDPVLRALYPEDLGPPAERLRAFLVQYFGGPPEYALLRGEPRLRLRHLEFAIDTGARDRWVACMSGALSELSVAESDAAELLGYFGATATFLVNRGGLSLGPRI